MRRTSQVESSDVALLRLAKFTIQFHTDPLKEPEPQSDGQRLLHESGKEGGFQTPL